MHVGKIKTSMTAKINVSGEQSVKHEEIENAGLLFHYERILCHIIWFGRTYVKI